jgi:antitoxin MazE
MLTALRKMGNSTGMILPKAILKALGVSSGTAMELRVEKGVVLARPITTVRAGWAEDAALIGALEPTEEERAWADGALEDDGDWEW